MPKDSPEIVQEYLLNEDKNGRLTGVFQWVGLLHGTIGDQRNATGCTLEQVRLTEIAPTHRDPT